MNSLTGKSPQSHAMPLSPIGQSHRSVLAQAQSWLSASPVLAQSQSRFSPRSTAVSQYVGPGHGHSLSENDLDAPAAGKSAAMRHTHPHRHPEAAGEQLTDAGVVEKAPSASASREATQGLSMPPWNGTFL